MYWAVKKFVPNRQTSTLSGFHNCLEGPGRYKIPYENIKGSISEHLMICAHCLGSLGSSGVPSGTFWVLLGQRSCVPSTLSSPSWVCCCAFRPHSHLCVVSCDFPTLWEVASFVWICWHFFQPITFSFDNTASPNHSPNSWYYYLCITYKGLPRLPCGKESVCQARDGV